MAIWRAEGPIRDTLWPVQGGTGPFRLSLLLWTPVPHPFRFLLRKGWDTNEIKDYAFSEE